MADHIRVNYFFLWLGQCILLALAVLRESQAFWLNSGGYPVWLRELVESGFYPYLLCLSVLHWSCWPGRSKSLWNWTLWGFCTFLWGVSILWFSWNNLENLFSGRGLHEHPF